MKGAGRDARMRSLEAVLGYINARAEARDEKSVFGGETELLSRTSETIEIDRLFVCLFMRLIRLKVLATAKTVVHIHPTVNQNSCTLQLGPFRLTEE